MRPQAAARFSGEDPGIVYSRFTNPTVSALQERLAALEGAECCIATASGMSAILGVRDGADESRRPHRLLGSIFGATVQLFGNIMQRFGVETTFVPATDVAAWEQAVRPEHASAVPGNALQSADRDLRHRGAGGDRAPARRAAGGRQLLLHARRCSGRSSSAPTSSSIRRPSIWTARAACSAARCSAGAS